MLLALVDILRCPVAHEETSLVLSVEAWSDQRVEEGLLGCPICHARFPIQRGAVDFTAGAEVVRRVATESPPDAMRLAAQLSLSEPGGVILLVGVYAAAADQLVELAGVTCILVDAPLSRSSAIANFDVAERLPLGSGVLKGAAIDDARANETFLREVARCVGPRRRLVAPASSELPSGGRLIASDELESVVEFEGFSLTTPLRRANPT